MKHLKAKFYLRFYNRYTTMKKQILLLLAFTFLACENKREADLLIHNATIYSVDNDFTKYRSMAIRDGKVLEMDKDDELVEKYIFKNKIDLDGKFVYPGFIDGHAHLYGLGQNLGQVDLKETQSFDEVIRRIVDYQNDKNTDFILGRGWDQNDWESKEFPTKDTLDQLFPDTPVAFTRIDGHAYLVNQKALDLAGIDEKTRADGGEIIKKDGELTGVLIDKPMNKINAIIPKASANQVKQNLQQAEQFAFQYGLTSVVDAGLPRRIIELIEEMHQSGELDIRIYAMVAHTKQDVDYYLQKGIIQKPRLSVRSIKVYADGALGSRGAVLQEPYSDQPDHYGKMLIPVQDFKQVAEKIAKSDYQMNTHAIGDSANAVVLRTYQELLKDKPDRRWRVEHAQVLNASLYDHFSKNIIPSVQPTHATSDMYWAEDRLGQKRVKHAYANKKLLDEAGILPLGTDFPVEQVNPLLTFYAAVSRQDESGYPEDGFQKKNALNRKEALKGMTIWAAYANFEEKVKGSLEVGKYADFVVFDQDLMETPMKEIPDLQVDATYLSGKRVFEGSK